MVPSALPKSFLHELGINSMDTLLIAAASFVGFIVAYHTYGRWLARRVFGLEPDAVVPSQQLRDDVDFVPTKKEVIFGHHFTSIAGTGPIVGPALAVFWGWLPALLWVVLGSIFIGAVHDFGALVVSLRNRGQTVGQVAGRLISKRARVLFLLTLFFALTIVLAIFGLVIALIFAFYPESVLSVWIEIPLAVFIGYRVYRHGAGLLGLSIGALLIMYGCIWIGVNYLPIDLSQMLGIPLTGDMVGNTVVVWTLILMAYCFVASVLPVWTLLQPRDYINSHQLMLALGLLCLGLLVAGVTGEAQLANSAPMIATNIPADAPPIWPFLFITIACGAISGFHCLVSSGTTSKQLSCETDAQYVGYGAMLLEGALAVIVILACCAGVGMGKFDRVAEGNTHRYVAAVGIDGQPIAGRAAWESRYDTQKGWAAFNKLAPKVGAFIEGGANFIAALGLPLEWAIGIVAVLVASFAATTLDTATRLQRYVVQELASTLHIRPLTNKYLATLFALVLAAALAIFAGDNPGSGGAILWPLFGATNQLLAGLAFMVTVFYLWRRNKPILFAAAPMLLMLLMPAWAMLWNLFNAESGWWHAGDKRLLSTFGVGILTLQMWMIIEAALIWPKAKGVLEEALPELTTVPPSAGGRSC
jgi:carbon starvation protein